MMASKSLRRKPERLDSDVNQLRLSDNRVCAASEVSSDSHSEESKEDRAMYRVVLHNHATSLVKSCEISEPDSEANQVRTKLPKSKIQLKQQEGYDSYNDASNELLGHSRQFVEKKSDFSYATSNFISN